MAGGTEAIGEAAAAELSGDGHDVARLAGADRYGTAVAIADEAVRQGASVSPTFLASGRNFPDALASAPVAHATGGVLLLVDPASLDASTATRDWLVEHAADIATVRVAGGSEAIADQVLTQIEQVLAGN